MASFQKQKCEREPITLDNFCNDTPAEALKQTRNEAAHARMTFHSRAETVKDVVRRVLRDYPETRNSKYLLVQKADSFLEGRYSPDGILRRAREIQNDEGKYLPDGITTAVRIEEQESSRERARQAKQENRGLCSPFLLVGAIYAVLRRVWNALLRIV